MTMPLQKPGRSKQDYSTPADFLAAVKAKLQIQAFDWDFAADAFNAKAPNYYSIENSALARTGTQWAEVLLSGWHWGWLNPPFNDIAPWAERCRQVREAQRSIALLIPAAVGANYFRDFIDGHAHVLLLNGRLAFIEGHPKDLYPKDCVLCLFSPWVEPGYEVWNWRTDVPQTDPVAALIHNYRMGDPEIHRAIGQALKCLNIHDRARYYEGIRNVRP